VSPCFNASTFNLFYAVKPTSRVTSHRISCSTPVNGQKSLMRRYTFRAAVHDVRVFYRLCLQCRRTNKNRRKGSHFGWLSRYAGDVPHNNRGNQMKTLTAIDPTFRVTSHGISCSTPVKNQKSKRNKHENNKTTSIKSDCTNGLDDRGT
jgi:hypothetical protein